MHKVAVIGAGMAGLSVARSLQAAGAEVTVFDKSQGTGGRLSSRSFAGGWIDHGAPYFSIETAAFEQFLATHTAATSSCVWQPKTSGLLRADDQVDTIGVPRNSAITRSLLGELGFRPATRIARLAACREGWQLFNDDEDLLGIWSQLVLAVPAPQALALLKAHPPLVESLGRVRMEPCWVAAIRCKVELPVVAAVSFYPHPVIRRIVHNSAKPGRQNENVYVVQATKNWSEEFLETPGERVGRDLLENFRAVTATASDCELLFVHRWRYAFAEIPLGESCLWDEQLQIGVCGDWCLGRRVENAWQSGTALAARMLNRAAEEAVNAGR